MIQNEVNATPNFKKETPKTILPKNILENIKSKIILKRIFDNLCKKKKLNIIKYNKNIQNRLNLDINDYDDFFKTIIEIIPADNE